MNSMSVDKNLKIEEMEDFDQFFGHLTGDTLRDFKERVYSLLEENSLVGATKLRSHEDQLNKEGWVELVITVGTVK